MSNLIMAALPLLAQSVVFGILLVLAVSLALKMANELNGATRGLIWLATLVALPLIPVLCWMNHAAAPVNAPKPGAPIAVTPLAVTPIPTTPAAQPETLSVQPVELTVAYDTPSVLTGFYCCIVTLFSLRLLVSYLRIRRLRRRSYLAPADVENRLQHWLARCPTNRPVKLALHDKLRSPVAIGFFRPLILIPSALLLELSEEEFDDVGVHELAHIRRYDDWTNLLLQVLKAALFFHPAVYWAGRKLKFECEIACDNWVVAARGPKSYAQCLAKVVELRRWQRVTLLASGAFFSKHQLLRRVELLLDRTSNNAPGISGLTTVAVILLTAGIALQISKTPAFLSFSRDSARRHTSAEWKDNEHDLRVRLGGEFTLSPDEHGIGSLSPDGYLEINESREWWHRRLEVRSSPSGLPVQKYFLDGRERPLDEAGREWEATTLPFLMREMAIDIDGRVDRNMAHGGVPGVLDEIELIHSGNTKYKYIKRLVEQRDLSEHDLRRVTWLIRKLPSDHEKAELLLAIAPAPGSCELLKTVASIQSDAEKARMLQSDGESRATECGEVFFAAVNQIHSDGDRKRVLQNVLDHAPTKTALLATIESASRLSSDSGKAQILVAAANLSADPEVRAALKQACQKIHSDNEYRRVADALFNEPPAANSLAP